MAYLEEVASQNARYCNGPQGHFTMHISNEVSFKNSSIDQAKEMKEINKKIYLQILHFIFLMFPQWITLQNPPF